jgi:hypothetical protein
MIYRMILILFVLIPSVLGVGVGSGINLNVETEIFAPRVFMCDSRAVLDDNVNEGRVSSGGEGLVERINNYAFEGEQISWKILVVDKNGIEDIRDVVGTIGPSDIDGNDREVECSRSSRIVREIPASCEARILEERLSDFDDDIMSFYDCVFTVETPEIMHGEYFISVEAVDSSNQIGSMSESEYWFLNPTIALLIDGSIEFGEVRPGTTVYSNTILIGNDAEDGSGVILDMFISGSDFYDSSSSGARCPSSNVLSLKNVKYYSPKGSLSSSSDLRSDSEGYIGIGYGDTLDPFRFRGSHEILQIGGKFHGYWFGNLLYAGGKMPLTFKLEMPEPCSGHFDSGDIFVWGEAV